MGPFGCRWFILLLALMTGAVSGLTSATETPNETSEEPANYDRLNYEALQLMAGEDWVPAFKKLKKAMELDPTRPEIYLNYARAHFLRHEYNAAERAVLKTLDVDPDMAPAWYLHAQLMAIKGEPIKSYESVQKAIAIGGPLQWNYLVFLGELYAQDGKWEKAKAAYDAAIKVLRKQCSTLEKTINTYGQPKDGYAGPTIEAISTGTALNPDRNTSHSYVFAAPSYLIVHPDAPEGLHRKLDALKGRLKSFTARKAEIHKQSVSP